MEECLTQMDACFNLLIPRFDLPELSTQLLTDSGGDWSSTSTVMPVRKEERRRRATISSGSFASLSNTDDECGSDEEEEEDYVCEREEEMEKGRVCGEGEESECGLLEDVTAEKQDSVVATGANCFKKGTITLDTKGKGKAKGQSEYG